MGIKIKILLLTITSLIIVLFVSTYYNERIVGKNAEDNLRDEVIKIVKQIDSGAVTGNELTDIKVINENLGELMDVRPNIVRIDLYTFNDLSLKPWITVSKKNVSQSRLTPDTIGKVREDQTLLNIEMINSTRYVNITAPVHFKGSVFGLTEVKISREEFDTLLSRQRRQAFIIAIVSVILIASILIVLINRMIYDPVQKLLFIISRVKEGDLKVAVTPVANDELGRLTESFNDMIQTIRKSRDEKGALLEQINSFNEQLQYKVEVATRELQKKNEELRNAVQFIYKIQKQLGHSRKLAAVGQLAASFAHELGTPLHSILGHLQLLMEEPGLSKDSYRRLGIMHAQLERVIESIHHTLDTTRSPDVRFDLVNLNRLIEDIVMLVLPETTSRQITVSKDLQQDLPLVYGNSSNLQDVLLNLIDNAIDACGQGDAISILTRRLDASHLNKYPIKEQAENGWVQVTISDNGHGITEEELKNIFEPFYTTKARGHGTGLGLAISQEIIRCHSGVIAVESRLNEGSIFTVLLPLKEHAAYVHG